MNFPTASPVNDERKKNPLGNFPSSAHECHFASHIYLTNLTDGLARACNKHTIIGAGIGRTSHTTLSLANWASLQQSPIPTVATRETPLENLQLHPVLFQQKTPMKVTAFLTLQPPHKEQSWHKNFTLTQTERYPGKWLPLSHFPAVIVLNAFLLKMNFPH